MSIVAQGSFLESFLASWSLILVSEIGDKTFFIACLLAMRYPRFAVFVGAIGALAVMTVLSALLGIIFPTVLSVRVTQGIAVVLFLAFGVQILRDAFRTRKEGDEEDDEMQEAAAAIGKKEEQDVAQTPTSPGLKRILTPAAGGLASGLNRIVRCSALCSPVVIQTFTLTFVAEWGDRSQIATIALAAAKNAVAVTLGGVLGHTICTGGAVMSGNLIASRISHRSVNIIGGCFFIFFGLVTAYQLIMEEGPVSSLHHTPAATIVMKNAA